MAFRFAGPPFAWFRFRLPAALYLYREATLLNGAFVLLAHAFVTEASKCWKVSYLHFSRGLPTQLFPSPRSEILS